MGSDRKLAVWEWKGEAHQEHMVEVRMKWGNDIWKDCIKTASSSVEDDSMPIFYVKMDRPDVLIESGDLRELAQKVVATLDGFYKIEWASKLVVSMNTGAEKVVDPEANKVPLRTSFKIRVREVGFGTSPTGKAFYRHKAREYDRGLAYQEGTMAEAIKPPKARYGSTLWDKNSTILGVVDDTPENRAAIQNLCDRVDQLRMQLITFMQGDDALQHALTMSAKQLMAPKDG